MLNKTGMFRAVPRPEGVTSHYSLVVVDGEGRPHLPLTKFYDKARQGLSDGAARTYLHVLLPYFGYLSTDHWRRHRGDRWDSPPEAVQESVRDYLVERLACKIQPKDTYMQVSLTAHSPSTVRVFLSALKLFYHVMRWMKHYPHPHPFIDSVTQLLREIEFVEGVAASTRPRLPQISGVEEPGVRHTSENYFRLEDVGWTLQPINDLTLHKQLIEGFEKARLSLRDQIVVRMAYESGARIGEILQLTVGDWRKRGCNQEATAFSKGSHGRRVKNIRFDKTTAKMLRQYVNTERSALDGEGRRLDDLEHDAPLVLSRRRRPYSSEAFKPNWYRLCDALKIDLNVHGLRHWYVSQEMRLIAAQAKSASELKQKREELIRYMAWRSPETLKTYEHVFEGQCHMETQDRLHHKWYEEDLTYEQSSLEVPSPVSSSAPVPPAPDSPTHQPDEGGWDSLLTLGGFSHA